MRAFKGNIDRSLEEKDVKLTRDLFRVMKRNVPGVSLWYSRVVVERLLLDQIDRMIDPKFDRRIKKAERRMKKDFDQDYWWTPGRTEPRKSPFE